MMPVAIIFDNFGPYHIARLQAAARVCDLRAIEVAGASATYAWKKDITTVDFRRVTLIEQATSGDVSRKDLARRLENALDEAKPGVVVVPGWASPAAWAAMDWSLRHRLPMVCMSESTAWDEPRSAGKEWIKRKLIGLFSSALVGGERHSDYLESLGMPSGQISFGYDAIDNAYFSSNADTIRAEAETTRRRLGLPPHYFLSSARFVEKKNLPRLLEAYALYRKSNPSPWSLVLLGDGPLRGVLESQCSVLDLRDHVFLPGFKQISELPAYYALAGGFMHPSTIEPWGLVVNEAAASGLPLLVSDRCGCALELVLEGVNGFTFDPFNVEQMAERMTQVSAPDFPHATFGEKSRKIVAEWGPERFARGLVQAINAAREAPRISPSLLQNFLLWLVAQR